MNDVMMSAVFSVVMLVFMIAPSIYIVGKIDDRFDISERTYNVLSVVITVILSLIAGLFLRYA